MVRTLLACMLTVAAALQAPVTKVAPIARSGVRRCEISCGDGRARREKRSRVKSALRARRELPPGPLPRPSERGRDALLRAGHVRPAHVMARARLGLESASNRSEERRPHSLPPGPASIRPLPSQAKAVAPKFDAMPIAAAVAPLAVAAPAEAFTGNIAGIPINLIIVGAAPAAALLVALTVIGTGALQQLGRVLSGESKGYFGEN